jgi:hypothetical protein
MVDEERRTARKGIQKMIGRCRPPKLAEREVRRNGLGDASPFVIERSGIGPKEQR